MFYIHIYIYICRNVVPTFILIGLQMYHLRLVVLNDHRMPPCGGTVTPNHVLSACHPLHEFTSSFIMDLHDEEKVKNRFLAKLESICMEAVCSWASLSVWPAAIPLLGLSRPIMVCLCAWEGSWNHWGLLQMSAGSPTFPFWHKKQSIRSIFFTSLSFC